MDTVDMVFEPKQNILILVAGPIDGLNDTLITAQAKYPANIIKSRKKTYLSLH